MTSADDSDDHPMFEPDILLPSQLLRPGVMRPERRLLLAVLEDAIVQLRADDSSDEALHWFESDRYAWGSFCMIADEMGIRDVEFVRQVARDVHGRRLQPPRLRRSHGRGRGRAA